MSAHVPCLGGISSNLFTHPPIINRFFVREEGRMQQEQKIGKVNDTMGSMGHQRSRVDKDPLFSEIAVLKLFSDIQIFTRQTGVSQNTGLQSKK